MKRCPSCAEEIRIEAKKCKHCGTTMTVAKPMREWTAVDMAKGVAKTIAGTIAVAVILFFLMIVTNAGR